AQRVERRAQDAQRRQQLRRESLAADAADSDRAQIDAGLGYQARLESAGAAEPDHRHVARAQGLRDGDAGEDVAARAAGKDQQRAAAARRRDGIGSVRTRFAIRLEPRAHGHERAHANASTSGASRRFSERLTSKLMRSSRPIAAQVIITLEPPELISGS